MDLVFRKADDVDVRFHLATWNPAKAETGPTNEFCLEIRFADVLVEPHGRGVVALYGGWLAALDRLLSPPYVGLRWCRLGRDAEQTLWAEELPLCGVTRF